MADSRKSAPNYWCKHCKMFVRDSPLEKRNHETSPRHQGNLQRFVKELHKANAREERDAQRAKNEAARLNGIQPGASSASEPQQRSSSGSAPKQTAKATPEDRRRQMAQLAAMGVVVPEEFRRENAMTGEWATVATHPITQAPPLPPLPLKSKLKKETPDEDVKPSRVDAAVGTERKRKLDGDAANEDVDDPAKRRPNWGSDVKRQRDIAAEEDLDALLAGSSEALTQTVKKMKKKSKTPAEQSNGTDPDIKPEPTEQDTKAPDVQSISAQDPEGNEDATKSDAVDDDIGSMFKKRRKKISKHD